MWKKAREGEVITMASFYIISEKEYRKEKAEDILDNWFDGSAKELFTALSEKIPKSEKERLKGVLDDMDFI